MAKRKNPVTKTENVQGDYHTARKMFRISDALHEQFRELARRNKRPMSWEIRIALENHLSANGMEVPPEPD